MSPTRSTVTATTRLAAVAAAALLALVACSASRSTTSPAVPVSEQGAPAATTTRSTILPTALAVTEVNQRSQLVVAVRRYWNLYLRLGARTGPFDAAETHELLRHGSHGDALLKLYVVLRDNAAARLAVKGTVDSAVRVVSVTATKAIVVDCQDDETGIYRVDDGRRIDRDDPQRHRVLTTLERVAGIWTVSDVKGDGLGCVG